MQLTYEQRAIRRYYDMEVVKMFKAGIMRERPAGALDPIDMSEMAGLL